MTLQVYYGQWAPKACYPMPFEGKKMVVVFIGKYLKRVGETPRASLEQGRRNVLGHKD